MKRTINFAKRNLKELFRDVIMYVFCIAFPIVLLVLFSLLNIFTQGNTPMFELKALVPSIMMFSYTFVMLIMALLVSKDRQTSFLRRLYSSPMRFYEYIIGYAFVGVFLGVCQSVICLISGFILSLIFVSEYIAILNCLLVLVSQMPMMLICVFLGIFFGTICNDKSAPAVASIFISISGVLGGCWMPIETMGGFERFARFLPFYPSVIFGKISAKATNIFGKTYLLTQNDALGFIPLGIVLILSIALSCIAFKKSMVNDK